MSTTAPTPTAFFERYFQAFVLPSLAAPAIANTSKLLAALSAAECRRLENIVADEPTVAAQLIRCLVGSEYLLECCCREPSLLLHWLLTEVVQSPLSIARINEVMTATVGNSQSPDALDANLRHFRRQIMLAIIWRDLNRLDSFTETAAATTALAELCLQQAAVFHFDRLVAEVGAPIGDNTRTVQPFLIIGMGKLGGSELNLSSDIDIIFAFPESGHTDHATRPIDNQQFFTRLGQRLIKTLNTMTASGFVFRVDMRLRPYGDSGNLVDNLTALETYYQTQGRDWERFAMIKARLICIALPTACTGHRPTSDAIAASAASQLDAILKSFTYRGYVDFSVIAALRRLKLLINQEIRRKGMDDDIKMGAGGIREIEFIVQAFQLIRGGRDKQLQGQPLLPMLRQLAAVGCLAAEVTDFLAEAYLFLRNTEHALQAYRDEQTQCLPRQALAQQRLAWVMGYADWQTFNTKLQYYRKGIDTHFQRMVADPLIPATLFSRQSEWSALWQQTLTNEVQFLQRQGFSQPQQTLTLLSQLTAKSSVQQMSATARERLDLLMPLLLSTVANTRTANSPDQLLTLMLGWLEKVIGRTVYMVLLLENPSVLVCLTELCGASLWIAAQLTQLPSLLDELLDIDHLYSLPDKMSLRADLRQQLIRIGPDDLDALMETLRYFRISHSLHAAAGEVTGHLPLMKVSDYLTFLAEVILEQVLIIAWRSLVEQHGAPDGDKTPRFIIVGYGKLGGLELGYDSDLDLVFIYRADTQGMTAGKKPIDNQTFYTRMGQKIIHMLNTRTLSGQLYEVDMRLRPSGNSGMLVTSMKAFERYQSRDAWIWEHQALARARVVAGHPLLAEEFDRVRCDILCRPRALSPLQAAVVEMREKMRAHLGSDRNRQPSNQFHLKQDAGGIVDIEFIVQYAVLAWSHRHHQLAEYTDNMRILSLLSDMGILPAAQSETLAKAYKSYREMTHQLAFQQQAVIVDADAYVQQRQQVKTIWLELFGATCSG